MGGRTLDRGGRVSADGGRAMEPGELTDDAWWDTYTYVEPTDGDRDRWLAGVAGGVVTFTSGETAPLDRVWTVVDWDDDDGDSGLALMAGLHHVNRQGYVVTAEPATSDAEYVSDWWWHV